MCPKFKGQSPALGAIAIDRRSAIGDRKIEYGLLSHPQTIR